MRIRLACVLLGLLAACGSDTNKLSDGAIDSPQGTDGSTPDTSTIDAAPAAVTVTVTLDGAPAAGAVVYFLNADSSVVSSTTTAADGTASAVMDAGGSVTVIEPPPPAFGVPVISDSLDTFAAVKPGDQLHLDLGQGPSTPPVDITFDLTVPTDPAAGIISYELDTTCGGQIDITPVVALKSTAKHAPALVGATNAPVSVTLSDCNGTADLVIITRDDAGAMVSSLFVPGQAVADATPLTVTGTYVPVGATTGSYTNLETATDVTVTKGVVTANGPLFSTTGDIAIAAGSGSGDLPFPVVTATQQVVHHVFSADLSTFESQDGFVWGAPSDTYAYDGATDLLPHFTADPVFDPATHTTAWMQAAGGHAADGAFVVVSFDRIDVAAEHQWTWAIAAPGTPSVTFPTVPTDVFDFNGTATDAPSVNFVETQTFPGGYDAFRPVAFFSIPPGLLATASGSLQFATSTPGSVVAAVRAPFAHAAVATSHHGKRALVKSHLPAHMLRSLTRGRAR